MEVTTMTNEDEHTCAQDKVGPILHKFRLRLKKRMQEDLRLKCSSSSRYVRLLKIFVLFLDQIEIFFVQVHLNSLILS